MNPYVVICVEATCWSIRGASEKLEAKVNDCIKQGYQPSGGVSVVFDPEEKKYYYYQAMIHSRFVV